MLKQMFTVDIGPLVVVYVFSLAITVVVVGAVNQTSVIIITAFVSS